MKDYPSGNSVVDEEPNALRVLRTAIPFVVTLIGGTLVTAVAGLFVYVNAVDPHTRDLRFSIVGVVGLAASIVAAWFAARRAIEAERSSGTGQALSLLKKYRRAAAQPGADSQTGQYSIGENYLRELLGRRGA